MAALLGSSPTCSAADTAASAQPTGSGSEATLAEYRQHLVELNGVVAACAKARDTKSCDPALVRQDDHVPLSNAPNAERRLVRYNWLRVLFLKAQLKDEVPEKAHDVWGASLEAGRAKRDPSLDPLQITVGGIVANNASGMCCGVAQNTYHTLESLTFLLPSGTEIDTARPDADDVFRAKEPALWNGLAELRDRVRAAVHLILTSPDYIIQK